MTTPHIATPAQSGLATPKPLYEQVKGYVLANIESGDWPTHTQIPSEHTLVRNMKISRMTIHRALRELTQDGYLDRIQGVGTFVANRQVKSTVLEYKDIITAIEERGHRHQCDIHFLQKEPVDEDFAVRLKMKVGEEVCRLYAVHRENGVPVLLEDRYVVPAQAPHFLDQDFEEKSADAYFRGIFGMMTHDHQLQACMSSPEAVHFLELEQPTSCIQINRRSWVGNNPLSLARLTYPGNRYHINW